MSNDGRYLYQHNQGLHSQYEYSYPSYDSSVLQHANHRPVRTPSQSHSPQQAQYNPPPSSPYQQPTYPPGSYLNPPPTQQWTGDNNWSQYNQQNYAQQPQLQPEATFHSGPGRPQPALSTPVSPRNFVQPTPARHDGRQTPATVAPINASPQNKNRRNDLVVSPPVSVTPQGTVSNGLDFRKLLDSYKLIIDANNNYSNGVGVPHARAPPMDTALVERMLQAASLGAQMLDSAAHVHHPSTTASPPVRSPKVKEPEPAPNKDLGNSSNSAATAPKRPTQKTEKSDDSTQEGQTCLGCGATSTPEWRRGPMGPRTLCNACGLVYAKLIKKRVKESARAGKTNEHAGRGHGGDDLASSVGDSDDDDYRSRSL